MHRNDLNVSRIPRCSEAALRLSGRVWERGIFAGHALLPLLSGHTAENSTPPPPLRRWTWVTGSGQDTEQEWHLSLPSESIQLSLTTRPVGTEPEAGGTLRWWPWKGLSGSVRPTTVPVIHKHVLC